MHRRDSLQYVDCLGKGSECGTYIWEGTYWLRAHFLSLGKTGTQVQCLSPVLHIEA